MITKPIHIIAAVAALGLYVGALFGHGYHKIADAQTNNTAPYSTDALQAYGFPPTSDPNGGWTPRKDFAAHEWHPGTDIPSRSDWQIDPATGKESLKWPILAYYKNAWYPSIVWYYDNNDGFGDKYRSSNGSRWGTPERWAYVRQMPEVWNPESQRMEVPGLPGSPPVPPPSTVPNPAGIPKKLQHIVDGLTYEYPANKIQDALDDSQYKVPQIGAPFE